MRKHGGTPSRRDKHVTLAANSPPGDARGRSVGGQQSGLAGCKLPPLYTRGAPSCSSQGRRQGEPWGASPRLSAPTPPTSFYFFFQTQQIQQSERPDHGHSVGDEPRIIEEQPLYVHRRSCMPTVSVHHFTVLRT